MGTSKWAFATMLVALFTTANAADPQAVSLSYYEPLNQVEFRTVDMQAANASQKPGTGPVVMSFNAMGQGFDLELEPNSRLLANVQRNARFDGIDIYRGEVAGKAGSWARIVVVDGTPRGMFYDGQEMYAIEAPGDSLVSSTGPVIFRLADVRVAPGAMSCGASSIAMTGAQAYEQLAGELGTMSQAQGAIEEIGMGAIGDYEFTNDKGGDANAIAAIATRLNNVDGYFSDQLGIQITVNTVETFESSSDPFSGASDAAILLEELSDYRSATAAQNSNGLTHLYTGRVLDGSTVGIAWEGSLCSNYYGAGLSEGNGSATFDSLVAAHEIGHNFGAPHDGEVGSNCESETGDFIMTPRINGSQSFSQCSITEMTDDIARASCISALPAVDVRPMLTSGSSALFGASSVLSYDVRNVGSLDATGVTIDLTLPANITLDSVSVSQGTCTNDAISASCDIGDVPGQATRTVDLTTTPTAVGAGMLTATVSADVDERPSNDQNAQQFSVNPAVDLVVSAPAGSTVRLDNSTTVTATLENRATLDATGVTLTMDIGTSLSPTAASWSIGSCTIVAQQVTCVAATFAAQSNTTVSVTATGISEGTPRINYALSSIEADLVPSDNDGTVRIEVKDPDEGGGPIGPLFLGLLSLAALLRRRA